MRIRLKNPHKQPITGPRRFMVDGVAMLVYLLVVYVWSLRIGALGRDFAALNNPASLPFLADRLFTFEIRAFGSWTPGYHLVNIALLYACMLCVYRLVRVAVKGYFWLGTLAATLFMANPVHTEVVANLSGVADLIPALFALLALTAYAENATAPRDWKLALAFVLYPIAVLPFHENAALFFVLVLLEVFVVDDGPRCGRLILFAIVSIAGWIVQREAFSFASLSPGQSFIPVYLIFYPIGFLPETVRNVLAHPWLGWLGAFVAAAVVTFVYRKSRRPAILFGVLAALAVRVCQGDHFIDPVHMTGGGRLLVSNALFNLALVALFHRIMDKWQWRRPIIMWTTLFAVAFFVLEIRSLAMWRHADEVVRDFQGKVANVGETVGVFPDYRHYLDAPIGLSESIAYDTPFSRRHDAVSILALDLLPPRRGAVEARNTSNRSIALAIRGKTPLDVFPYPYTLARPGAVVATSVASIRVDDIASEYVTLSVQAHTPRMPFPLPLTPPGRTPVN